MKNKKKQVYNQTKKASTTKQYLLTLLLSLAFCCFTAFWNFGGSTFGNLPFSWIRERNHLLLTVLRWCYLKWDLLRPITICSTSFGMDKIVTLQWGIKVMLFFQTSFIFIVKESLIGHYWYYWRIEINKFLQRFLNFTGDKVLLPLLKNNRCF